MAVLKATPISSMYLNSPWAFDAGVKPPFVKGMVVKVVSNGTHAKKGSYVQITKVSRVGGDWFLNFKAKCKVCSMNEHKAKTTCGGWVAGHFAYPETTHGE